MMKFFPSAVIFSLALSAGLLSAGDIPSIDQWASMQVDRALVGGLEPVDFPLIHAAFRYRRYFSDWGLVDRLLTQLTASPRIDPLIGAELASWRARIENEEGHSEIAREIFSAQGGVSRWWVLPAQEIDELESFDSVARLPVENNDWRFVPGTDSGGWLRLEAFAWPARRQVLTLGCTVQSSRRRPVALRIGLAQVGRIWLNGRLLMTSDFPLKAGADQLSIGAMLEKGRNTLIVAVASETSDWWLRLRITAPDGSPLSGVKQLDEKPVVEEAFSPAEPIKIKSLKSEIKKALKHRTKGAEAALASLLADRSSHAADSGNARAACLRARPDDPILVGLEELRLDNKEAEERDILMALIDSGAPAVPAGIRLARWYADHQLPKQAHDLLRVYDDEPSARMTGLLMDSLRWGPVSLPEITELAAEYPRCLSVQVDAARQCLNLQHRREALRFLDAAEDLAPLRREVIELRRKLAADCGLSGAIRTSLEEALANDPNSVSTRIRLGRIYSSEGNHSEAVKILEEGLHRCPGHVDLLLEAAHLDHLFGHDQSAAEKARRVLKRRPQNLPARRLLTLLGEERHEEKWRRDLEELRKMTERAAEDQGPAVMLLDHREVRFLPGNLSQEFVQQVYLVKDAAHAENLKTHSIAYVPERQDLRILSARMITTSGDEINARLGDTPRLADPSVNMYYDTRLKVLSFDELVDGSLLEMSYILSETAEANETGVYQGGILRLADFYPTIEAEIELTGPEKTLPEWESVNIETQPVRQTDPEGMTHILWVFKDLPALFHDVPAGPDLWERPYLAYSNHPDWKSLSQWYFRHVAPRIRRQDLSFRHDAGTVCRTGIRGTPVQALQRRLGSVP